MKCGMSMHGQRDAAGKESHVKTHVMKHVLLLGMTTLLLNLSGCGGTGKAESTPSAPESAANSGAETLGSSTEAPDDSQSNPADSASRETPVGSVSPATDEELYRFVMDSWKSEDFALLYPYADDTLKALISEPDFINIFSSVSEIGGTLLSDQTNATERKDGTVFSATLDFENVTVDLALSVRNARICGINRNVHFKHSFELRKDGYIEQYFVLENDGCRLNAVHTYVDDGQPHPSVLFIGGSGPSDYNETIGLLAPFADLSEALAKKGINSLRIDKRTLNYGSAFQATDTINEEYLLDCGAAIDYLKGRPETASVSLLGHSLGGQVATVLAADRDDIESMILFNSTARPLIDVLFDQLAAASPAQKDLYQTLVDNVKSLTEETATGRNYLGVSDHYWIAVNGIAVIENIKDAGIPTLIVNSRNDNQIFEEDVALWQSELSQDDSVTIYIDDSMSHYGYEIDTKDQGSLYRKAEMPERLTRLFAGFLTKT